MKLFGQDIQVLVNQLKALLSNLLAWLLRSTNLSVPETISTAPRSSCVAINGPGGLEKLELLDLGNNKATVGYNVASVFKKGQLLVDVSDKSRLPSNTVVVRIHYYSINYADICIRWGLYESALKYVGWPIVPGFDLSGVVEWAGEDSGFKIGDQVFGFSMFGAYSSCLVVPASQIRKVPEAVSLDKMASIPAVAATALHALSLAGGWPQAPITKNKAVLIHSAAGGVGSMLIQMCKVMGYSPVVAVVGSSNKKKTCLALGADHVIIKAEVKRNLWKVARDISPDGYVAIFDANGIETLQDSYDNLCRCGRVVTYGFHSNLPKTDLLSPLAWVNMIYDLSRMPRFDPMHMVLTSKAILGFNLSFFADEHELIEKYMHQIVEWIERGQINAPEITLFEMNQIREAHAAIQSGLSVGKILVRATKDEKED